jgi:hypothetical protein
MRIRNITGGALAACFAVSVLTSTAASAAGNGAPSGAHYNLNIIGVSKDKSAEMSGNQGHRIFVPLYGKPKIWLSESPSFEVYDANGTDSNGASFGLPNPDPDADGITEYSVYARALGTPGGSSTTTTCAYDDVLGETYCSTLSMVLVRDAKGGKSSFTNYSRELLYVYQDFDGDGIVDRMPLFGDSAYQFYWDYDNQGLKLAQLRFYEISTDVN